MPTPPPPLPSSVSSIRNSPKHIVCVDMLREGYHASFSELFALIQKWNASREAAGPGSAIWQHRPLEEQPSKLHELRRFLTRAEAAQRAGLYEEVYENQVALAHYFKDPEDIWLSHYFYEAGLKSARLVASDEGRREAEANGNMGDVCMERGDLEAARDHYEAFHRLSASKAWLDATGRSYAARACEGLWKTYTLLAEKMLADKDYESAIGTLVNAFVMAQEAGNKKIEGEAAYRVGLGYQCVGDHPTARSYLHIYMEISSALGDHESLGKAYKAIAQSLESEGKFGELTEFLEKFVKVSSGNSQNRNLVEACMYLGVIYRSRGEYDKGCTYLQRAYDIGCGLNDLPLLQKVQVHLGSARAHHMMMAYSRHVEEAQPLDIRKLLAWKDSRSNDFYSADSRLCDVPAVALALPLRQVRSHRRLPVTWHFVLSSYSGDLA
ncbi:tetratricopeptide repeat protein 29-like [Scleropages formosus]|uniref:Tetratricopeptide repeat protein 29 n=1 Tax=Scleropages formosus TaxID=113540 RepID=A0A0P7UPF7_SCLFO|nr:tetratricopeptide repeat protein 29-like [Scleropages formosus]